MDIIDESSSNTKNKDNITSKTTIISKYCFNVLHKIAKETSCLVYI